MKPLLIIVAILLGSVLAMGQRKSITKNTKENKSEYTELISDESFDKMIVRDITYAIFGDNNPVSGIKIDVSKPEATLSGVFKFPKTPSLLLGIEFKGGSVDRNFPIFKGLNSFNTSFEFVPTFHVIPAWSKASFSTNKKLVIKAINENFDKFIVIQKDTFYVNALIYNHHLSNFKKLMYKDEEQKIPSVKSLTAEQRNILIYFVNKFTDEKDLGKLSNQEILDKISKVDKIKDEKQQDKIDIKKFNERIVDTYNKYSKLYDKHVETTELKHIQNSAEGWTLKRYKWLSFSPYARAEKLNVLYDKYYNSDSLYIKQDVPFYFGLNASFNTLIIYPNNIVHFLRAGAGLGKANNIKAIDSFNYEERSPLFNHPNSVTQKLKSGIAYNNYEIRNGVLAHLAIEYYLLPIKKFLPGLYTSGNINLSNIYNMPDVLGRENDFCKIPFEIGTVFNINNREKGKEKSLLSILMYVRNEDLTDRRRTPYVTGIKETHGKFYNRNISYGIRIGIPITLPEKTVEN